MVLTDDGDQPQGQVRYDWPIQERVYKARDSSKHERSYKMNNDYEMIGLHT